jgi:hypothetical protein
MGGRTRRKSQKVQGLEIWRDHLHVYPCKSGCELWIIERGFTHEANVYMECVQRTMEAAVLEVEGLPRQLELLQGLSGKTAVYT